MSERTNTPAHAAVVLGMFETGLGVARSLGRAGIRVIGVDRRRDVGFRSRYVQASLCPDPLHEVDAFIDHLVTIATAEDEKPVLFVTSDDFLLAVARNRERLRELFLLNLPETEILESIVDKYLQYELARSAGIPAPATLLFETPADVSRLGREIPFPVFVKAREVTSWREAIGGNVKGFLARTPAELEARLGALCDKGVIGVVQELIPGPDSNHYKACCYVSKDGKVVRAFALRKLRQQPPGFGFGSLVESVYEPEVLSLGERFMESIGYRGVGSAEFKRDERDGVFKLIELNPRYWQQNALAERCNVNFPLAQYQDLTGEVSNRASAYDQHVKWVNVTADLDSFRVYRRRGELDLRAWLQSLEGPKVYSNFAADDPIPGIQAIATNLAARRPARALVRSILRGFPKAGAGR